MKETEVESKERVLGVVEHSSSGNSNNSNSAATPSEGYRDIVEDYLETISDNLIASLAFFHIQPNPQKHQHYEDILKAWVG